MTVETAILWRGHTDSTDTVEPVGTEEALAEAMRDKLRVGIVAQVVTREVSDWEPAPKGSAYWVAIKVARELVEQTLEQYLAGDFTALLKRDDRDPLDAIAFLTPHLIDEPTNPARTDVHLTRAHWWDELVDADDRARKLHDGSLDPSQYDADGEDERRDYARDVLAGVVIPGHAKASA